MKKLELKLKQPQKKVLNTHVITNCNGCKWQNSDDRMKLCPICNSNYDMYEKLKK